MKKLFLGNYLVLKPLGMGASASVYLVQNLQMNRQEALKICADTEENRQTLLEEIQVLKRLNHPMLPEFYEWFQEDGCLCMAMEYVEGITLERYLRQFGKLEEEKAIFVAIMLTEVLGYLHRQKPELIYRDLKPANIMMLPNGRLKLIDFGAVWMVPHHQLGKGLLAGTPGYSSPEQWKEGGACRESDIYALGMVLRKMLSSKCISRRLEKVIIKCTKELPQERYRTMYDVRRDLHACRHRGWARKKIFGRTLKFAFSFWLIAGMALGALFAFRSCIGQTAVSAVAAEKAETLWVDVRDERGRKCLLREENAYKIKDKLWLELQAEDLPAGISTLKIIAIAEDDNIFESRVFLVENN